MANVTLKQLRYFEALSRTGHFGHAADLCHVTQPALSMQIQELEAQLGVQLVERRPRGVVLTAFGEDVARRAAQIGQQINELSELAVAAQDGLGGTLRLGVIPTIAPYLLPPLIHRLREVDLDAGLKIRETMTHTLTQELRDGQLDVIILALPVEHPDLDSLALFDERFLLVHASGEAWDIAHPSALKAHPLLLLEEGHCFRDQTLRVCGLGPDDVPNALGASSLSTLMHMVASGLGVTLVPEMAATAQFLGQDLNTARFGEPEPVRTVGLAWRKGAPREAHYRRLGELLKDVWSARPIVAEARP